MRITGLIVLTAALLATRVFAQKLSADDKKMIESARANYYNLEKLGLQSFTCSIVFDFSTIPFLPTEDKDADLKLLEAATFTLSLDRNGPVVKHQYASGANQDAQAQATKETGLLESLVAGLFQTWPSKGWNGPIPPFDSQIESVAVTENGYRMFLRVPGGPVRVEMDKNYLVKEIVSVGGKIDERPVYTQTPEGLILTGNDALDDSGQYGKVDVKYDIENTVADGLRLPSSVHLRVNENIDLKFALKKCSATKGTVIVLKP